MGDRGSPIFLTEGPLDDCEADKAKRDGRKCPEARYRRVSAEAALVVTPGIEEIMPQMGILQQSQMIPQHVAIIMDGNGRWARERRLPRFQGHIEGVKRIEEIAEHANRLGVRILTVFAFSTENWRRPKKEVSMLMNTVVSVLEKRLKRLLSEGIRLHFIGKTENIPEQVLASLERAAEKTKANKGLTINLAFNYGSRQEIVDAVRHVAQKVSAGQLNVDAIDEQVIAEHLYTCGMPDPDLLIRTSGEQRISNFLLWQISYAELYFTDKYWPDFRTAEFDAAIKAFQRRERRFGKTSDQV